MSQIDLSEDSIAPPSKMGSKIIGYLAKAIPKKMIASNKPVLKWLEGVDDPSPPRFRVVVVTDAEKKAFDLLKRMNGHKFRAHVPLVPEPLDDDDGPVSRQLHQERAIPSSTTSWSMARPWSLSGSFLRSRTTMRVLMHSWKWPGPARSFSLAAPGRSMRHRSSETQHMIIRYSWPHHLQYMVKFVWNEKKQERQWTSKAKAKVTSSVI
ncbi:hypothetical protein BKA64DRAFT_646215 [Cadophora sp. MPI-SDFR-AT-0126]|nr:hypothetical protein BKA64DRAFT_646215 [Leotiomycetes sp. MPI-SDFR-AT-0126]